ncbi:MAG: hypothetical protein ACI9N9_002811 [Enterobacterales bacterium]|jgi:hypothetical protein
MSSLLKSIIILNIFLLTIVCFGENGLTYDLKNKIDVKKQSSYRLNKKTMYLANLQSDKLQFDGYVLMTGYEWRNLILDHLDISNKYNNLNSALVQIFNKKYCIDDILDNDVNLKEFYDILEKNRVQIHSTGFYGYKNEGELFEKEFDVINSTDISDVNVVSLSFKDLERLSDRKFLAMLVTMHYVVDIDGRVYIKFQRK